jgi:hypothetical protein
VSRALDRTTGATGGLVLALALAWPGALPRLQPVLAGQERQVVVVRWPVRPGSRGDADQLRGVPEQELLDLLELLERGEPLTRLHVAPRAGQLLAEVELTPC